MQAKLGTTARSSLAQWPGSKQAIYEHKAIDDFVGPQATNSPFTVADADFGGKTQDAKQRSSFNLVTQLLNLIFFTNTMLKGTEINVPKQICFFLPYSGYVK